MSILARFTAVPAVTTQQYDEKHAAARGVRSMAARRPRVPRCLLDGWQASRQRDLGLARTEDSFAQRLMPLLSDLGVELEGPPEVIEVYNTVKP